MRTTFPLRTATAVALGIAFASSVAIRTDIRAQEGSRERTMYVSAVDDKGEPVKGLGPEDFVIREDGAQREVLRVTPAIEPMDIAILVDDSAASEGVIPRVREGLTSFINAMSKGNQIALIGLADRPTILVDYSSSTTNLLKGVGLLWPRTRSGSTFMDAMYEVSRGLERRDAPRAVIVPVLTDGTDFANRQYEQVMPEVKKAGVTIDAITIGTFSSTNDQEMRNRARMLSDGTRDTGGQRVNLFAATAVQPALERLARELSSQYKVVYGRPESLIPPEKIQVTARRGGVTMRGTLERGTGNGK